MHVQLLTESKLFCGDSVTAGRSANSQVGVISLGHPGTLPTLNRKAIELAVRLGIAMNCEIERYNYFARKNYFYPDLPKGYQITQHTAPICKGGYLDIGSAEKPRPVHLNRIHLEEDAGKSLHDVEDGFSCLDLNRAGVPLLEIVTEPDIRSSEEAFKFLTDLRKLVRWIDVCDGNMEEGSMRCDANISIRPFGSEKLGTRVEIKNLNSIRNVRRAIEIEVARLTELAEAGEDIFQETRSYDADRNITFSMRSKEEADDYRYFPDPDLPAFTVSEVFIQEVKNAMPLLPAQKKMSLREHFLLSEYDADVLTQDKETADYYTALVNHTNHYKAAANWMTGPVRAYCNEHGLSIQELSIEPKLLGELINFTESGAVSFTAASSILFQKLIAQPFKSIQQLAAELNLLQEKDDATMMQWVDEVIAAMPEKVQEFRKGKKALLGLFAGEVKKLSKGKADMQIVTKILSERLNS